MKLSFASRSLTRLKKALHETEVNFFSYWDVTGVGNEKKGATYIAVFLIAPVIFNAATFLLSFLTSSWKKTVKVILETAYTGAVGDGKVFVLPVEEAYRIRTKEKGTASLN